ncbi:MAG TPA: hypothetical protein VM658_19595 [bacterium]|nr:hypothetical protein [bacterium]
MKRIFMSMLEKDQAAAQKLIPEIKKYGLAVEGHFWTENVEKMEWMGPRPELLHPDTALWLIVAGKDGLASPANRFGLSLLSITVQAGRGMGFPIIILHGGKAPAADDLPTPLKHAQVLSASSPYGAKLVATANVPFKPAPADYRMDVYGLPSGLGLWFEVGPAAGKWSGAMFGVSPGDINAHGVAKKGELPTGKMVLNYPMQGLKLKLGDKEFTAWAVKNEIDEHSSYFLRAVDMPDTIVFGPFSEGDAAEVFTARLI